jgi:hypothetical protein
MRYMISSHPEIFIPPESNFIPHLFAANPGDPMSRQRAIRALESILGYKVFFRDWEAARPDPDAFLDRLPDLRPATILDSLYREYASQHGASRWGDKSPIYTSHIEEISQIVPGAQFIHIIRDGRDVSLSMLKSYEGPRFFYVDLCYATRSWKRRVQDARNAGKKLGPDEYLEVRYEELISDTKRVLEEICEFIGEDFSEEMLHPEKVASTMYHSKGIHGSTRSAPAADNTQKWKREMSESDVRLFSALAGDLLEELGYEVDRTPSLGWDEHLRLSFLQTKYATVEGARRLLRASGVAHPARLLARR